MIVRDGFDGLSMHKLGKAAKVSPATIYIYYKNREDLLNRLFNDVEQTFSDIALKDFDPESPFDEGLWRQWKNRLKFILKYPVHYKFLEQFRNSPLINHKDVKSSRFKDAMGLFVKNAIKRGDITVPMERETFWALAFAPFYALVNFHLTGGKPPTSTPFKLTEAKMRTVFDRIIKAFKE